MQAEAEKAGTVQPREEKVHRVLINVCKYQGVRGEGNVKKMESQLSLVTKRRGYGHKLKLSKLPRNIRKLFSTVRVVRLEQVLRSCGVSVCGGIHNRIGHGLGQPAEADPA